MKTIAKLTGTFFLLTLLAGCGGGGGGGDSFNSGGSGGGSGSTGGSGVAESITVTAGSTSIVANGVSTTTIRATVVDDVGDPVSGDTVDFTTTAGSLSAASATTNSNGVATVTLTSGTNLGSATVFATSSGFSASVAVSFIAGPVSTIVLSASPGTIPPGQPTTLLATVTDTNGNPVSNESVQFSITTNNSGGTLSSTIGTTNSSGLVSVTYTAGVTAGTDTLRAVSSNGTADTNPVVVDSSAAVLDSLTLTSASSSLTANGTSTTLIRATVRDTNSDPVIGVSVNFATTAGTLSAATATTNASGVASVTLTAPTTVATADVTASIGGFNQSVSVDFVAGPADAASSSITGSPSSLPADGTSTSTVTVLLVDVNGNLVTDGTSVTLLTSDGTITSTNPSTTALGRATFTLKAPSTTATATLTVSGIAGLSGTVAFGTASTGDPANILMSVGSSQVAVAGVGQPANTSITINVKDSVGNPIDETSYGDATLNNLRVSILSQPNGGEYVSGTNANGDVVTTQSPPMLVRTVNGAITLNFQSGTLPGVVEIKVEALLDVDGVALGTPVAAIAPQISVASGPASSIVLTYPITDSIENLGGGVYRRIGTALVTDRYGNAVPDGTAVNFGILDSVIAMGSDAATTASSDTMTSASATFLAASITRNGTGRSIETSDRILMETAPVADKSRFVSAIASGTDLTAQSDYVSTSSSLNYVVGASMIGTDIFGLNASDALVKGSGVTTDGSATFKITYPANVDTILTGCYGYGGASPSTYSAVDTRYTEPQSAQVYVVATSNNNSASTVVRGTFCLAAVAGFSLAPQPGSVSLTTAGSSAPVTLVLTDGGDGIRLPFYPVTYSIEITSNSGGTFDPTVAFTPVSGRTDADGEIVATITNTTGTSGDAATITFFAGDATATVAVSIP